MEISTKKLGSYELDIINIKDFKKYLYEHKDSFAPNAFNSYLKTVDIPPRFFKEQPIETQEELLDNRETFVASRKKYANKVIVVLRINDKILNACRLGDTEAETMYDKLKGIDSVSDKFEHRSFYKDGYITYIIANDIKNNTDNNALVVDFPILLNKPVVIHKAVYTLPNDSSVVPVEHIHYLESEEVDLYVDYKDIKSAIEDKLDYIKTGSPKKEVENVLRENELVVMALIEAGTVPKSYLEKVVAHINTNLKGVLDTKKLESFVLDFDEDLKSYKQVTSLRCVNGSSINKILNSETFKKFVEEMEKIEDLDK